VRLRRRETSWTQYEYEKSHSLMRQNSLEKKNKVQKVAGRESRFRAGRVKQAESTIRTG